jgi:GGDEF domain-containing protein
MCKDLLTTFGIVLGSVFLWQSSCFPALGISPTGFWMKIERTQTGRTNAAKPVRAPDQAASLSALISTTPLNWEGTAISVSVSHGLYSFSGTEDAGEALQWADQAMYEQKHSRAIGD